MFYAILKRGSETVKVPLNEEKIGEDIRLSLSAETVGEGCDGFCVFYDEFSAKDGDCGFYIIPETGWTRLVNIGNGSEGEYYSGKICLHTLCGKIGEKAFSVAVTGMRECYNLSCSHKNGEYRYYIQYDLDGEKPYEDFSCVLHYYKDGADYNTMAVWYREFLLKNGYMKSLKEKVKNRPALRYATESTNLRIRMGWKPAPAPVAEQTPENEPPMTVLCTFKMVEDLIDCLVAEGVQKLDICLVGWNISGHDGRWPQMFPVDPRLGGEDGLKRLIEKAKKVGYTLNLHTNCYDAYTIADNFSWDYIAKNSDGTPQKGGIWSGGQSYLIALPYYKDIYFENLKKLKNLGVEGVHYTDVLSLAIPIKSSNNPKMTPKEYVDAANETFREFTALFGGASSEGGNDLYAESLDFGLYSQFNPDKVYEGEEWLGENIPFWYIVMHGTMLYNATTSTINHQLKSPYIAATQKLVGGRPAGYCFVNFLPDPVWGREDLRWNEGEMPYDVAKSIALADREYAEYKNLQYEFIEKHEFLENNRQRMTYGNGTSVTVDFNTGNMLFEKK